MKPLGGHRKTPCSCCTYDKRTRGRETNVVRREVFAGLAADICSHGCIGGSHECASGHDEDDDWSHLRTRPWWEYYEMGEEDPGRDDFCDVAPLVARLPLAA